MKANRTKYYIYFSALFLLTVVISTLVLAGKNNNVNQLMSYTGNGYDITDEFTNTSGTVVNITNTRYFNADGITPYVYHAKLPDVLSDDMYLNLMTKNMGYAIFVSDDTKAVPEDFLVELAAEENNILLPQFKNSLKSFITNNKDVYHLTDLLSAYCGLSASIGTKGMGTTLHSIDVDEYAGKDIYIVLYPVYASSKIGHIMLLQPWHYVKLSILNTFLPFIMSIVIVIIASATFSMALFMENVSKKYYGYMSLLVITIGLWCMLSARTFDFVLGTSMFVNTMSYYLLMFMPLLGAFFVDTMTYHEHPLALKVIGPLSVANIIISTVLNYTTDYDLENTRFVSDILIMTMTIWGIILCIKDIRYRQKHNLKNMSKINIFNLILVLVCTIIDYMRISSVFMMDSAEDGALFIRVGILVFMAGMLLDIYSGYVQQKTQASLASTYKSVAYIDELTQIENRTAYAKYTEELEFMIKNLSAKADDSQSIVYIALDLNDLKTVNDTLGHNKGDIYIKTAARILKTSFHSGRIFRTGGDEFAVIITGSESAADCEGGLKRLFRAQEEYNNAAASGITMAFAYGISEWRYFDTRTLHQVSIDADRKMYAKKREMKGDSR